MAWMHCLTWQRKVDSKYQLHHFSFGNNTVNKSYVLQLRGYAISVQPGLCLLQAS